MEQILYDIPLETAGYKINTVYNFILWLKFLWGSNFFWKYILQLNFFFKYAGQYCCSSLKKVFLKNTLFPFFYLKLYKVVLMSQYFHVKYKYRKASIFIFALVLFILAFSFSFNCFVCFRFACMRLSRLSILESRAGVLSCVNLSS